MHQMRTYKLFLCPHGFFSDPCLAFPVATATVSRGLCVKRIAFVSAEASPQFFIQDLHIGAARAVASPPMSPGGRTAAVSAGQLG